MNDNDYAKYLRRSLVLKQVLEDFDKRSFNEYISSLHEKHCYDKKNVSDQCKLQIREIVLIKQENVPRLKWHKGQVMNYIVGQVNVFVQNSKNIHYIKNQQCFDT